MRHRFGYHPPRSDRRVQQHRDVRDHLLGVGQHLVGLLPDGREKSLSITKIEEAMFWANAALARADDPDAEVSADEAAAGP